MEQDVVGEAPHTGGKSGRRSLPTAPASRGMAVRDLTESVALLDGILMDLERFPSMEELNLAALAHVLDRLHALRDRLRGTLEADHGP